MSDITSLSSSFHTPTFFTKVRSCDVRFRLGSRVCVCLFCFVLLLLFCLL